MTPREACAEIVRIIDQAEDRHHPDADDMIAIYNAAEAGAATPALFTPEWVTEWSAAQASVMAALPPVVTVTVLAQGIGGKEADRLMRAARKWDFDASLSSHFHDDKLVYDVTVFVTGPRKEDPEDGNT